jgi:shikimate dehydrogenase
MNDSKTKLICIIGSPVKHSLSPVMYNAAFKNLKLNYTCLAFEVNDLKYSLSGLKAIGASAIIVTIPFKEKVMNMLDEIDDAANKIGAVNLIMNKNGKLSGFNTDWKAAIMALEDIITVTGKNVALLGAGGAARAIAYGLKSKKANVHIFNRTPMRAKRLSDDFQLAGYYSLSKQEKLKCMDIIINSTSVGLESDCDKSVIDKNVINKSQIVFDIVYTPIKTKLIKEAKEKGAEVILGYKMLLNVGLEIFSLITNIAPPKEIMEKTLLNHLRK